MKKLSNSKFKQTCKNSINIRLAKDIKLNAQLITVLGKTHKGEVFRPSDWHLRLACLAGTFDTLKRIKYNDLVYPTWIAHENIAGLSVNKALEQSDPMLYNFIKDFVLANDLQVTSGEEIDESTARNVGHINNSRKSTC